MAIALDLRMLTGAGTFYDLLGTETLYLLDPKDWTTTPQNDFTVKETFILGAVDTGAAYDIRNAVMELNDFSEWARQWHEDPFNNNSIWIRVRADQETQSRQALVYSIDVQILNISGMSNLIEGDGLKVLLTVVRHPFWEKTSTTQLTPGIFGWLTNGPHKILTVGLNSGAVASRLDETEFVSYYATNELNRVAMGMRAVSTARPASSFVPIWEAEDAGTLGTDTVVYTGAITDSSPTGGAGAANETVRCTFATVPGWADRIEISVDDIYSDINPTHAMGVFHVYARMRVDTSTTVRARLKYGYAGDLSPLKNKPVYVSGTGSWYMYDMGLVNIPAGGTGRDSIDDISGICNQTKLTLEAERIEGSGTFSLWVDAFLFIPGENFLLIENAKLDNTDPVSGAYIYVYEDEWIDGYCTYNSEPLSRLILSEDNWEMPNSAQVLAVAIHMAEDGEHWLSGASTINFRWFQRYLDYIGT